MATTKERIVLKGFGYDILVRNTTGENFSKFADARKTSLRNFSNPLEQFGQFLIDTHIPYQFSMQGAPEPWPELSPAYAAQKARQYPGAPILVRTKAMYSSFSYRATPFSLTVNNAKNYAKYHQSGTRKMPARKWLQILDNDLGYNKLREFMRAHIVSRGINE